ncbi:hypothetical protein [Massilia sp. Mn16-1_5]|uniref:hypothetical protein n=1 Tax=Massilia sp. Mn16-1_5 TaxID=2079199 RepID=UPI00109E950A|nr:hypothetical protein [Massilia sp. Mn16-1_5]
MTFSKKILRTPYENIVIGNFLYGMGVSLGRKADLHIPAASINNTQQTPLDPLLADVWLTFPGVCRLLEFKRENADRSKDIIKRDALRDVLADHPQFLPVSRQVHWFAEIVGHPGRGIDLRLSPFVDMGHAGATQVSMADYIDQFTSSALSPSDVEPTAPQVSQYLQLVGELASASDASGAGLMVHVTPQGKLEFIALSDIRDLNLQYGHQINQEQQITLAIEQGREQAAELTLQRTGPSMKPPGR